VCTAGSVRAEGPWEGTWNAGATRVAVSLSSWGPDCGPRPTSTTVPAAGNVRVSQNGDHLVFHGSPQRSTTGCWSDNRAVRRVSSSYQEGVWRSTCRTPQDDPRSERGTYTLRAVGDSRLDFTDASNYDWQLNESRCVGSIRSTQSFTRVGAAPAQTPQPQEPERPACTPGAPARMRLGPATAEIEPGGQVRFRAQVVDSSGCAIGNPTVRWELRRPASVRGELRNGVFEAAESSAEAEGEFRITATSGELTAEATVTVRTADLSDLIAKRVSGGVIQRSEEDVSTDAAAGMTARRQESPVEWWPVAAAGGSVLVLVLIAIVALLVRSRRRRAASSMTAADLAAIPDGAPEGAIEVSAGAAAGAPLGRQPGVDGTSAQALICPACRRGYPADARFCPHDSEQLVPYGQFVESHKKQEVGQGEGTKICPKCGGRYGLAVTFCGKDGAPLVLVN